MRDFLFKRQQLTTNTNAALREKLIDMIAEHLSGTYRCLRVWEAWNFGTMSQDDFDDVGESDTPPELADALRALAAYIESHHGVNAAKNIARRGLATLAEGAPA